MNNKVEFFIMYSILCYWNEWEAAKIACRTQINEKNSKMSLPLSINVSMYNVLKYAVCIMLCLLNLTFND